MAKPISIARALLSVSDKSGIVEFATQLKILGITIISTGGTAKLLQEHQIDVTEVSDHTGFPEIMGGRVKTIHPKILGGILGRRETDKEIMRELNIAPIDLVVVNLYPFAKTIADPKHNLSDAIENIDIGGPNMIRAAGKNYQNVTVVVDHNDYDIIIKKLKDSGAINEETRFEFAKKAFCHTAQYDTMIANYLKNSADNKQNREVETTLFPSTFKLLLHKKQDLRYGENPHQKAALYLEENPQPATITTAEQLQGKALSFNNMVDADTALECVKSFSKCACVIVKHANPCGVALGKTPLQAYQSAFKTDPTSSFGGIIAFNSKVDKEVAETIITQQFVEVIVAPEISDAALTLFNQKKNLRILSTGYWDHATSSYDFKRIPSGLLIQEPDAKELTIKQLKTVTKRTPSDEELNDLLFSWKVAKFVKSNAIVFAKNKMTIGIGAGQMSRVYSAKIGQLKAADENLQIEESVMASDAFFPFRDSIDAAAKMGITAIIQPGGSIRDEEVIQAANEADIAMVFTGIRHFRH